MNAKKVYELMTKYVKCPKCGSETVGNDTGTIEIKEGCFKRACPCGWHIEVKESDLKD